jgi:hypothetical protein
MKYPIFVTEISIIGVNGMPAAVTWHLIKLYFNDVGNYSGIEHCYKSGCGLPKVKDTKSIFFLHNPPSYLVGAGDNAAGA